MTEPTTPDEMRAALNKLRYDDPLVHAAFTAADYAGMSGEDRYTVLAYHAVTQKQKLLEQLLENHAMSVPVHYVVPK